MARGAVPALALSRTPPSLRLLAYDQKKPMLRILRVPDMSVEPSPVSLDIGYALDRCIRRDGWLLFTPDLDVWGLPVPFGERPFPVATNARVIAATNTRSVWLQARNTATVAEYDGIARSVTTVLELPQQELEVAAQTPAGFLLNGDAGVYAWEPPAPPRVLLADARAAGEGVTTRVVAFGWDSGELVVIDLDTGLQVTVTKPSIGRWDSVRLGVFSPDGEWLAVDLDYSEERAGGRGKYELRPHRLGIIRCADGAMTIADGVYDNFANVAWSLDGEWIALTTPFAPRGLWLTRRDDAKLEWISYGRRKAPSLLCDVSDLVE